MRAGPADGRHTAIARLVFSDRDGGTFCLRPGVVAISTVGAGKIINSTRIDADKFPAQNHCMGTPKQMKRVKRTTPNKKARKNHAIYSLARRKK